MKCCEYGDRYSSELPNISLYEISQQSVLWSLKPNQTYAGKRLVQSKTNVVLKILCKNIESLLLFTVYTNVGNNFLNLKCQALDGLVWSRKDSLLFTVLLRFVMM